MIFQRVAYIFRLLNHSLVHNGADFLHEVHIVVHHIFTPPPIQTAASPIALLQPAAYCLIYLETSLGQKVLQR